MGAEFHDATATDNEFYHVYGTSGLDEAEETIFDSPVHCISGDSSQQISSYSDFVLISSPSDHISTEDSFSFLLKSLDNSLNSLSSILFLQDDLIISIVFDQM